MIEKEDLMALEGINYVRLADMWCELNRCQWPEEIPNPLTKEGRFPSHRGWYIMEYIENLVGKELVSRRWNKDNMTEEEFYDFWAYFKNNDKHAEKRHLARIDEVCEE